LLTKKLGILLCGLVMWFGVGTISASESYLTDRDYQVIEQNMPDYQWAIARCEIPIEVLVAIHYRESGLHKGHYSFKRKVLVKNLGGAFMLDCGGEGTPEFEQNIRYEERKIAKQYDYDGDNRVSHNFRFACLVAANEIKKKARYGLETEEGIADTFWGYNGRVRGSYMNSAYVSSDPNGGKVMDFTFRGTKIVDINPGCMVLWKELKNSKRFKEIILKYRRHA
jgi:hypothetical protein